ncbi:transposase, IS4-like family protein [Leptospira interrogans serovar Medanensis str. L0448]|uniref:IS4 family transposase n=1 Tax=Leptospira interrogans TaxID=173 RepID=UPI0002BA29A4|nr:IS4 family transposase [Leptospira interrogans]EMN35949.1 transposase, IS4-like family protein [Leptospira interrogans serovar Medanensis str. L0448]EMN40758.1 transposase, IS4-like family protein [Leptospira interrogans str. L0996]
MNAKHLSSTLGTELDWVEEEYVSLNLGDKRLDKRLKKIVSMMTKRGGMSLPDIFGNWSGTKGAYRFFSNPKVCYDKIISPHSQATKNRTQKQERVLVLSDTTEIYYRKRDLTPGLGPMNSEYNQGLLLHPSIAFTTDGIPLGILDLKMWSRTVLGGNRSQDGRKMSIEDKESVKWIQGYRALCEFAKESDSKYVYICDREADIYELFQEYVVAGENAPDMLIRANHERKIEGGGCSWSYLETLEPVDTYTITVPRKKGKEAREATIQLRFEKLTIKSPQYKKLENIDMYALTATEIGGAKEESIDWKFLTTIPIHNSEDAKRMIAYYKSRWGIEVFFKVLKSGCNIESTQFKFGDRFKACIAVSAIVAWRVMMLTFLGRNIPGLKASILFESFEWKGIYCRIFETPKPPKEEPDLDTVLSWIAKLGGHLDRKSDAPPGPLTIFKGLMRAVEIGFMFKLLTKP